MSRIVNPTKGTPEWNLWIAAIQVATPPPLRIRGATTVVPAARVEALRAALDALGIDWRKVKAAGEERTFVHRLTRKPIVRRPPTSIDGSTP